MGYLANCIGGCFKIGAGLITGSCSFNYAALEQSSGNIDTGTMMLAVLGVGFAVYAIGAGIKDVGRPLKSEYKSRDESKE